MNITAAIDIQHTGIDDHTVHCPLSVVRRVGLLIELSVTVGSTADT